MNRLLNVCGCNMVFIASGCVISRTSERSERVSDITQKTAERVLAKSPIWSAHMV